MCIFLTGYADDLLRSLMLQYAAQSQKVLKHSIDGLKAAVSPLAAEIDKPDKDTCHRRIHVKI